MKRKTFEQGLQEQVKKQEQQLADLREVCDKHISLSSDEEIETQLHSIRKKLVDVKNTFESVDVIKVHCINIHTVYELQLQSTYNHDLAIHTYIIHTMQIFIIIEAKLRNHNYITLH